MECHINIIVFPLLQYLDLIRGIMNGDARWDKTITMGDGTKLICVYYIIVLLILNDRILENMINVSVSYK